MTSRQRVWPWLVLLVPPLTLGVIDASYGAWWFMIPALAIQALTLFTVAAEDDPFARPIAVR
jgi:hypothetical protein